MESLECLFCQRRYALDIFNPFCPECHEPMLCPLPKKKRMFDLEKSWSLEKFLDFLPITEVNPNLSLGEGNTPLLKTTRLRKEFKLPPLFIKNETLNPTSSFKDRGTALAVQKAVSLGMERIGTVSTGNMASSTAAYGAKAGLKTFVLLKEDIPLNKLLLTGIHNPVLIKVKGDYGDLFNQSFHLGRKYNIYFMNSVDPFRIEGYKLTGFEIFFQLERRIPRFIIVPASSGGHLIGLFKSFLELKQEGFTSELPILVGVQAQGCSPIAQAYASPPGGNLVLKLIKDYGGMVIMVSDEEILEAQKVLAESEGIFCQPASATVLAGLLKLTREHRIQKNDITVLVVTGSGLKALKSLDVSRMRVHQSPLSTLGKTMNSLL